MESIGSSFIFRLIAGIFLKPFSPSPKEFFVFSACRSIASFRDILGDRRQPVCIQRVAIGQKWYGRDHAHEEMGDLAAHFSVRVWY